MEPRIQPGNIITRGQIGTHRKLVNSVEVVPLTSFEYGHELLATLAARGGRRVSWVIPPAYLFVVVEV